MGFNDDVHILPSGSRRSTTGIPKVSELSENGYGVRAQDLHNIFGQYPVQEAYYLDPAAQSFETELESDAVSPVFRKRRTTC